MTTKRESGRSHVRCSAKLHNHFLARSPWIFGPWVTNLARNHQFTAEHEAFYLERSQGIGMMVLEEASVHPSDGPMEYLVHAYASDPGWRNLSRTLHRINPELAVVAALGHTGGQQDGAIARGPVWAPSPIPDVSSRVMPKEMEPEDIEEVVQGFIQGARRAMADGLDGIEINAAHYSLLRQFLSPLTNHRHDLWGGDNEGRLRFPLRVMTEVRHAIGPDALLGLRLTGDELAPWGGLTPEQVAPLAQRLVLAGQADYLAVEVGSLYSSHKRAASMDTPQDYAVRPAEVIRASLRSSHIEIPVIATGNFVDMESAKQVLAEEAADGIEVTRPLIADPQWAVRAMAEESPERRCVLCNQGCQVRSNLNPPIRCVINPSVGRTPRASDGQPLGRGVAVVVGGGPAGLVAASSLLLQGWEVTLFEREQQVGGRLLLAGKIPGRERWRVAVEDWERMLRDHAGIRVILDYNAGIHDINQVRPDLVVVSTGARSAPLPPWIAKLQGNSWTDSESMLSLSDSARVDGQHWLVHDQEDAYRSMSAVRSLVERGAHVTIVTQDLFAYRGLTAAGDMVPWLEYVHHHEVTLRTRSLIRDIVDHEGSLSVSMEDRFTQQGNVLQGISGVCLVPPEVPNDELYWMLKKRQPAYPVVCVGDSLAPRGVRAAVREGSSILQAVAGNYPRRKG